MLRVIVIRLLLVGVPFVIWFAWRAWAKQTGREMGSTPYTWLLAAGALLVGLSLLASVVLHPDNRGARYVPGEAGPGGAVSKGYFEKTRPQ